ncbi:hypothetical protein KNE206_55060 [Kitasatospora sp. NE20-6]|uniref:ABC transporter n=1 Tax=Kitasatospora sp. NE20-6 TaxID=2859066 RepID=UPI0034DC6D8D
MTALVGYQLELLLRSQRWLPPVLGYGLLMVLGISGGDEPLGGLAYAAGLLLPFTAWLVRCAVTVEPAAARACRVSAAGAVRVHRGALLTAVLTAAVLGLAADTAVLVAGGASKEGPVVVFGAGLGATAVAVLLGAAVGALSSRPVLVSGPYGILASLAGSLLLLLVPGAPAHVVVRELVRGARHGGVDIAAGVLLPVAVSAVLAVAAAAVACTVAGRRAE